MDFILQCFSIFFYRFYEQLQYSIPEISGFIIFCVSKRIVYTWISVMLAIFWKRFAHVKFVWTMCSTLGGSQPSGFLLLRNRASRYRVLRDRRFRRIVFLDNKFFLIWNPRCFKFILKMTTFPRLKWETRACPEVSCPGSILCSIFWVTSPFVSSFMMIVKG